MQKWLETISARKLAIMATLFFIALNALLIVFVIKDGYSPLTDEWTEKFNVEAAKNYLKFGFQYHGGLPVLSRQWFEDNLGAVSTFSSDKQYFTYLHYPAVSPLLAGLGVLIFGPDHIVLLRIIIMIANVPLVYIFFNGVFAVVAGGTRRFVFLAAFTVIPIGWNMLNSIVPNSHGHFVVLGLIGVLLPALKHFNLKLGWKIYAATGLMGFLAGCYTFDYFFIMMLTPVAVAALYHGKRILSHADLRKAVFLLCFWVGFGFSTAHLAHFMQMVAYQGSFNAAVMELWHAATYRAGSGKGQYQFVQGWSCSGCENPYALGILAMGPVAGRAKLVFDYLFRFTGFDFIGREILFFPIAAYLAAAGIYLWPGRRHDVDTTAAQKERFGRFVLMAAITVLACVLWLLVMENHGAYHTWLLPRHFYLVYIMIVLFLLENTGPTYRRSTAEISMSRD